MFLTIGKIKEIALDILFPPICLNCRKFLENKNRPICDKCLSLVKTNSAIFCPVCRGRLPDGVKTCHQNSLFVLAPAGEYDDPILQNMICLFKYHGVEGLSPVLGELMIRHIENCGLLARHSFSEGRQITQLPNFTITYIPLHKSRERQRGFNQAKLLAEFIASKFNLPLSDTLKRIKKTKPQAKMKNKEQRQKNISGCFQIENSDAVKGKNIILTDDVFTTGDTINEAVKILKENGAGKIIALVVARA